MGTIKQGIMGGFSGSVGGVVGSNWKGVNVVKSKPVSVANPQTAGQVEQRSQMTGVVAFAKIILSLWIKPLWDRFVQRASGFNKFVSLNIAKFQAGVLDDASTLVMSIGNMAATSIVAATWSGVSNELQVSWYPDTDGFHLASDTAYLLYYDEVSGNVLLDNLAVRSDGHSTISSSGVFDVNSVIHCWLVFRRSNGLYVSLATYSIVTMV